jgi:hypothetical protein
MPSINHAARINHSNVTEAADVPIAAPSLRLVAP